jgi:hypothetical protein
MASFRDHVLLELSDPARVGALLLPADDGDGQRVRTMLASTYDLSAARIDQIRGVQVRSVALQHPLFPVGRRSGVWSQTVPSYTRTELTLDVPASTDPVWVDLLVQLEVTVVTDVDPSGAEAVLSRAVDDFSTIEEFRERFRFIDLDDFLTKHHITTVDELRAAFDYVVTEVRLRTPATFDPNDPANTHRLAVALAVRVVDPFDLTEGLRAARLVRAAAKGLTGANPTTIPIESTAAYATAVVFAAAGLDDALVGATQQLFAREGVVSLFLNPNGEVTDVSR